MSKIIKNIAVIVVFVILTQYSIGLLEDKYHWALVTSFVYNIFLFLLVVIGGIFLQVRYGGFGPLSWIIVWLLRGDKNKLPEQRFPFLATLLALLLLGFIISILIGVGA